MLYPGITAKDGSAVSVLAWGVVTGVIQRTDAEAVLISARRKFRGKRDYTHLMFLFQDAVRHIELHRDLCEDHVCRHIAPLISVGGRGLSVYEAALSVVPDAILTPREVAALVRREIAWWTRLHAAPGGV